MTGDATKAGSLGASGPLSSQRLSRSASEWRSAEHLGKLAALEDYQVIYPILSGASLLGGADWALASEQRQEDSFSSGRSRRTASGQAKVSSAGGELETGRD